MSPTSRVPDRLVVDVVSPAQFTGASADGTEADTDIVTDAHGLPLLPRQRLAAQLRAGAVAAVQAAPHLLEPARAVFGAERSHGHDRLLRIFDAVADPRTRAAVARALRRREGDEHHAVLRRAVTDAFTALESSIQVDERGAPVPGRLRTNRVLLPGPRLTAPLYWAAEPTPQQVCCLARACLATTYGGGRSSRGRGRIDVRLAVAESAEDAHTTTLRLAGAPGAVREERT